MSFFNLFRKKETTEEIKQPLPKTIVLIPDKLTAKVFSYDLLTKNGRSKCLAYQTDGLQKLGQKELLLILKNKKETYELWEEPLHFFSLVHSLTEKGSIVNHGNITQFGDKDLFGWKGIVYADFPDVENNPAYHNCLSMILLTLDEVQAIQLFGHLRILSLLGMEYKHYPYPSWSDFERKPLPIKEIVSKSIVSQISKANFPFATVTLQNNEIILSLSKDISPNKLPQEIIPINIPIAIFPSLDKKANGCLVFPTDNQGPAAITPEGSDGSMMGGCVLAVMAEQETNFTIMFEDGFSLMLTNEKWVEFWESLINKQNLYIGTTGDSMDFRINWT